jgi:hypothetical protein
MAEKKKSYWEKRAAIREKSYQDGSGKTVEDVQKIYDKAFDNINAKLEKLGKRLEKVEEGEASYYLERSGLLKQIQDDVYEELRKVAEIERRQTAAHYAAVMDEAYYKTVFDIQKGTGFRYSFALLPKRAVNSALESVWLDHNYSKSV